MIMKKGLVFGIQHFSIHDGPGIRSAVFLKGCPLHCLWCHNPEGLSCDVGLQYYENDCENCGACGFIFKDMKKAGTLSLDRKQKAVKSCPFHALRLVGEPMSVEEIMDQVMKDLRYFKSSGGGITISGGEPMMQAEFAAELAKSAKEQHITTTLETSGFAALKDFISIMPFIDTFLWDYKATGEEMHKKLIGASNRRILSNLSYLHDHGANIVIRCPLIPGVNDTDEHLKGIADLCRQYPDLAGIEIMPYHKMGVSKAKRMGLMQEEYQVPKKKLKDDWLKKIQGFGGTLIRIN